MVGTKKNLIQKTVEQLLIDGFDFREIDELHNLLGYILITNNIILPTDINILSFDIKFSMEDDNAIDENSIVICPNNLPSALWFSGIFPKNPRGLIKKDKYSYNNKEYIFDKKEQKLVITNKK